MRLLNCKSGTAGEIFPMQNLKSLAESVTVRFNFSPEHQLLLYCARVHLTSHDREKIRSLINSPLNWEEVLKETRRQSIIPLLYRHLQAESHDLLPPELLEQLRQEYLQVAAKSMALAAELREITRSLEEQGVSPIPYKGPVLALQAYGDIALRTFTDIDLLVRKTDFAKARKILGSRGYSPLDELTPSQEKAVLSFDHNLPLISATGDVLVELHWRVAPAAFTFPMLMEGLWGRATHMNLGGETLRAMSVDDLMLILPVHGARHAWSAIEWITGIAELMRQPGSVCWNRVMGNAEELQVGRKVRLAVALANRLLDAPIPDQVTRWIEGDPRITSLVDWVAVRLFAPIDAHSAAQQWAVFQFEMAVKDGLRQQLRDGFRRVTYPTGKDWAAAGLPDRLFALYYVTRPFRLLARYLRQAVGGKA